MHVILHATSPARKDDIESQGGPRIGFLGFRVWGFGHKACVKK